MTRLTGTLHRDAFTLIIKSRRILLRMKNVSDKFVETIKTYIFCSIAFFLENRIVYGIIIIINNSNTTVFGELLTFFTILL
jgi:hypothetical protein